MNSDDPPDERVIYRKRFQAVHFDFRGKSIFTRYDRCEFVKCTLLIDHATEQLAFTACVFKDCNIDKLEPDEERGLYVKYNLMIGRWTNGGPSTRSGWPKPQAGEGKGDMTRNRSLLLGVASGFFGALAVLTARYVAVVLAG